MSLTQQRPTWRKPDTRNNFTTENRRTGSGIMLTCALMMLLQISVISVKVFG
jgi:hypothetical protein